MKIIKNRNNIGLLQVSRSRSASGPDLARQRSSGALDVHLVLYLKATVVAEVIRKKFFLVQQQPVRPEFSLVYGVGGSRASRDSSTMRKSKFKGKGLSLDTSAINSDPKNMLAQSFSATTSTYKKDGRNSITIDREGNNESTDDTVREKISTPKGRKVTKTTLLMEKNLDVGHQATCSW